MAAVSAWTTQLPIVLMRQLRVNTWAIAVLTGTPILGVTRTVILTASRTVTVTTVATTATATGTPTVATIAIGVTVAVPHLVVDVTHLIIGDAEATRKALQGAAALARILTVPRVTELLALPTRKMVAVGEA